MKTATTTYKEFNDFVTFAVRWQQENAKKSKLSFAIEKVLKENQNVLDTCQSKLTEISVEEASIEKEGLLAIDGNGNLRYTKEGMLKRNNRHTELLSTSIEVFTYIVTETPELSVFYQLAFEKFVIPESSEQ